LRTPIATTQQPAQKAPQPAQISAQPSKEIFALSEGLSEPSLPQPAPSQTIRRSRMLASARFKRRGNPTDSNPTVSNLSAVARSTNTFTPTR